jgi:hypothetical protein
MYEPSSKIQRQIDQYEWHAQHIGGVFNRQEVMGWLEAAYRQGRESVLGPDPMQKRLREALSEANAVH